MIPFRVRDPLQYSRIYSDLGKTRPPCVPPFPLSFRTHTHPRTHTHTILQSIILTKRLEEKVIFNPDIEMRWSSLMSGLVPFASLPLKRESLCQVPLLGKMLRGRALLPAGFSFLWWRRERQCGQSMHNFFQSATSYYCNKLHSLSDMKDGPS